MSLSQHVAIRVQQLANSATEPVNLNDLAFKALVEVYGSAEDALRALIPAAARSARRAIEDDQDLPDDGSDPDKPEQLVLIPKPPTMITMATPEGERIYPRAHQTTAIIKKWNRQKLSRHRVQVTLRERLDSTLEDHGEGLDDTLVDDAWPVLQRRKTDALTVGSDDAS